MPVYDFVCNHCGKQFEAAQSLREHDQGPPRCPACASVEVEQRPSTFHAQTSRKS